MNNRRLWTRCLLLTVCGLLLTGCACPPREQQKGPPYDRPFPLGQVTDAHWETQQTNAEASDFIFYDHEFVGNTAALTPAGQTHLLQVALRLDHVPFPIVIEQTPADRNRALDNQRRQTVVDRLTQLNVVAHAPRVVVAPAFNNGITAMEGESAYYSTLDNGTYGGGAGRRFGGRGGVFR